MAKKPFALRVDEEMMKAIEKWAADEFRSVNGQIEWMLHQKLKESRRLKKQAQKKGDSFESPFAFNALCYFLNGIWSETVSLLRPAARLRAKTFRPFLDAIRSRNPCLLIRFFLDGWNVRFIACFF